MAKKKRAYRSPPKQCPNPASLAGFPELMSYVRLEWRSRMRNCDSGVSLAQRVKAKSTGHGRKRKKGGNK